MLARLYWLVLTLVATFGLAAPAEAQLWKPKKKPAAAESASKTKSKKASARKAKKSGKSKRKSAAKRRARETSPDVDDNPTIVISDL